LIAQVCAKEGNIEKVIEINEYRSDRDFKILNIVFKLNCARTLSNIEKINTYASKLNAELDINEFFEDKISIHFDKEIVVIIDATNTFRAVSILIRFIRYLKESRILYDG